VIAQSLQKCDDKRVHELSLSIMQKITEMGKMDENIQLPSGLKCRLFLTMANSLGHYSSAEILQNVCRCTQYILDIATPEEKVLYNHAPSVEKIVLETSSLLSIASTNNYLGEVWKCLATLTSISNEGCRAFVSSNGLDLFFKCLEKVPDNSNEILLDITGI